ncbi:MarR family transcriptional regulator [Kibdelosporangium persicum]
MRADVRSWPTGRLLSVAARVVEGRFTDFLASHDLTHAGLIALHHLTDRPRAQRELAVLCRVTDQTISRTLNHLERVAYIRRRPDAGDRRRILATITAKGRKVLAKARREERESDLLLGAIDDYDNFRDQLLKLILLAGPEPSEDSRMTTDRR